MERLRTMKAGGDIPLRSITECDHCGVCCQTRPGRLGSYAEVRAIEAKVGPIRDSLILERRGDWTEVRISAAPCRFHVDNRCLLEDVKPSGCRDYECWNPKTWHKMYTWSGNQLRKLGRISTKVLAGLA